MSGAPHVTRTSTRARNPSWSGGPGRSPGSGGGTPTAASLEPPRRRGGAIAAAIGLVLLLACLLVVQPLRWRLEALALTGAGEVPDLRVSDLVRLMYPVRAQPQLSRLVTTRNPFPVIHVPADGSISAPRGARLFRDQCGDCHAPDGSGGPGAPALRGRVLAHAGTDWALFRTIRYGIPGTGMAAHPLPWQDTWDLAAYVRELGQTGTVDAAPPPAALRTLRVPYAELVGAVRPGRDWLTWSGGYSAERHSTLQQIGRGNVHALALRWMVPLEGGPDRLEASALVRDGVLFITGPLGRVMALDAATGTELWRFEHRYELKGGGEGPLGQNRGVALLDDRLYVGTWDSQLIALSAADGHVLWQVPVGPYPGTYISGAPLALRDLVVVGIGSPPGYGRGFIVAYDARTGTERWRFATIPGPGEAGNETWAGDSWRRGGAGSWVTGAYDPEGDVLYWGIGNPRPDFEPAARRGDNLYSDSLVALRASTGKLLWHFQFTPADEHDWDSCQVPLLRRDARGKVSEVLFANRNGFFYRLDARTGAYLNGSAFVRQTWTPGLDAAGRPRPAPAVTRAEGTLVWPGAKGGTNWWPPSYDPQAGLVYVPVLEQGMIFFPSAQTLPSGAQRLYTAVRALDAATGRKVWEYRHPERSADPNSSGLLSTDGGLVFGADHGTLFALDSRSGELLWHLETHGSTYAPPMTYQAGDEQFVAIIAGRALMVFALPR